MNQYLKFSVAAIVALFVFFGLHAELGLIQEQAAIVIAAIVFLLILIHDKINWRVFLPPREVLSVDDWRNKAVAALERNYPGRVLGELFFEAEILQDGPVGVLWVSESPDVELHERRCCFGEVWKDSQNYVCSPLATLQWHLRSNYCKSKLEAGLKYLKRADKKPEGIFKPSVGGLEKKLEVVTA